MTNVQNLQPQPGYSAVTHTDHGNVIEIYETGLQYGLDGKQDIERGVIFSGGDDLILSPVEALELARHLVSAAEAAIG